MNSIRGNPTEITSVDHRIAFAGGLTSTTERLPQNQKTKNPPSNLHQRIEELVRENGRLRQEVCHAQEQARALLSLYTKSVDAQRILREATQATSDRLLHSDNELMRYFGVCLDDTAQNDFTVL
jgi:hypothetical protein